MIAHMESAAVRTALRALPEREMEVVTLKVWEGLTLVEIAVRLGMSKSRAGQLWQSGIKIKYCTPHSQIGRQKFSGFNAFPISWRLSGFVLVWRRWAETTFEVSLAYA